MTQPIKPDEAQLLPLFAMETNFTYESHTPTAAMKQWKRQDRVEACFITLAGTIFAVGISGHYVLPGGIETSCATPYQALQKLLSKHIHLYVTQSTLQYLGRYSASIDGSNVYVFGALLMEDQFTDLILGPYESIRFFPLCEELPLIVAHRKLITMLQQQMRSVETYLYKDKQPS